jgi:fatty acid CoA ligase FadD9
LCANDRQVRDATPLDTITYAALGTRMGAIATEWRHNPAHPLRTGEFVCTLGSASSDYPAIDLACVHHGPM